MVVWDILVCSIAVCQCVVFQRGDIVVCSKAVCHISEFKFFIIAVNQFVVW